MHCRWQRIQKWDASLDSYWPTVKNVRSFVGYTGCFDPSISVNYDFEKLFVIYMGTTVSLWRLLWWLHLRSFFDGGRSYLRVTRQQDVKQSSKHATTSFYVHIHPWSPTDVGCSRQVLWAISSHFHCGRQQSALLIIFNCCINCKLFQSNYGTLQRLSTWDPLCLQSFWLSW